MYVAAVSLIYALRFIRTYASIYKNFIYWFILLFLFVFSAFRFEVGCDWRGYLISLSNATSQFGELTKSHELIWALVLLFIKVYEINYFWINVISSFIFFFGAHYMAQRQQNRIAFLLLLFPVLIINMPMSGIRQASAIGALCIAFIALLDRSTLKFTFFVFAAFLLHKSSIIFLALLPLTFGDLSKSRALILFIPAVLAVASLSLTDAFAHYILIYGSYGSSGLASEASGAIFRTGFLAVTSLHYFLFLRKPWKRYFKDDYQIILIFAWLMFVPIVVSQFSSVMGDRFAYYLIPMQVVIFTRIPYLKLSKQRLLHILYPYIYPYRSSFHG